MFEVKDINEDPHDVYIPLSTGASGALSTSWTTTLGDNYHYALISQVVASDIMSYANIVPGETETFTLGSSTRKWDNIFAKKSAIDSSDRNKKNSIQSLSGAHDQIFDALKPVSYKFNQNNNNRTHTGLIAQDVKEAVENAGLTTQDFAAYCEWENEDGSTGCGLRYGEFISLCIDQIQKLKKRVEELEDKLNNTK